MKYFPYEDFEIHTKLSPDEIFYRLCTVVDTERKWWIFTNKPFWGEVSRGSFRIWRSTWWSRNFTPITFGIIQNEGLGSCITIWMRMPWYSFLFYSFVFGLFWLSLFVGNMDLVVQRIKTGNWQFGSLEEWFFYIVLNIVALAFIYLISVGTFKSDVRRIKDHLLRLSETAEGNLVYHDTILGITEPQIIKTLFVIPIVISFGWMIYKLLF